VRDTHTDLRELEGTVDGKLRLGGTLEAPEVKGSLRLSNGSLSYALLTSPVRGLEASLFSEQGGRGRLGARGKVASGDASVQGELLSGGGTPTQLTLRAKLREVPMRVQGMSFSLGTETDATVRRGPRRWVANVLVRKGTARFNAIEARTLQ